MQYADDGRGNQKDRGTGTVKSFDYKDSLVAVREWETGIIPDKMQRTCFCCGKKVNNCKAVLLINNYKYIPNVMLHSECFSRQEDKAEELCDCIQSSYKQYRKLESVFGSYTG